MTQAQSTRFYFPAWNRAFTARWRRDRGTILPREGAPVNELAEQVETMARARAARRSAPCSADDLRHACHVGAFGRDISSKDLTNAQVDRVVALFELLADPDNLSAQMRWAAPDRDARRRLEWSVQHSGFPEAYVLHICSSKFSSRNWRALTDTQLRQLIVTLKSRAKTRNSTNTDADSETANGSAGRVVGAGGADHGDSRATGVPACAVGMPGPEGEEPF